MENPETKAAKSPPAEAPEGQPNPKKPKVSTIISAVEETTASAAGVDVGTAARKPKYKRRKVAIFFAYCGVGYQGMQKNPGAKTIEGELEEALFHSGAVQESERGNPRRYDWARSARTDKGVSAVGQVVSGRFYIDPPGLVDRLNSSLPGQIRIFGYKRVTPSFSAKKFCDRRRYVYLIPLFALDPYSHREAFMASSGSVQEFMKCLECSERGRKLVGVMGRRSHEEKSTTLQPGISSNSGDATVNTEVNDETVVLGDSGSNDNPKSETKDVINEVHTGSDLKMVGNEEKSDLTQVSAEEKKPLKASKFFYDEKEKERFNRILNHYVGSHNFHNFTTRTKAEDPSARRYIVSFNANTTINVDGIEFVKCEVVGQSFMLHQIRKMIGLAVAIMRNFVPESLIETAFRKDVNINAPMAPEVGLYLDECIFTSYNKKWKDSHEELSMKQYEDEAEAFKMKHIYPHIASTEHKEGVVALWLHSLSRSNYPDLTDANADGKVHVSETNGEASGMEVAGTEANGEAIQEKGSEERVSEE